MAENNSEVTEFMVGDFKGHQSFSNFDKLPTVVGTADPHQVDALMKMINDVMAQRLRLLEG
ncbi:hypothetical protein [Mycobacteroides abscessus]|uniref:hypothetical protein n=1 Tax=Mycobacteroides abscessus TaxID=36809 RepID=UPI0009A5DE6C|nr:hypothetical protein [Mycobacteroides abscessus]SKH87038.1 Uncharacterised protein [Mycobacteroides abscessus subsp. massiliense]SKH91544.1 Uncharacterised protein [Mycobacteroides abscessus subsp. massiliense]SKI12358.1 Uncharacterised protein [Mycobacteroides abscessus subsp. massiliense]SKK23248.1 Uncharacterised protein [Mycobacteroides abscessus subsp. massiliense]SKK30011.1 Uncharacterised protein [Mycobacteroides abscessus subsp. massiliense]